MEPVPSHSSAYPESPNKGDRSSTYTLYELTDGTLFWNPPKNSYELEYALKYHFPNQKNKTQRMLVAIEKFNSDIKSGEGVHPNTREWKFFCGRPSGLANSKMEAFINGKKIIYGNEKKLSDKDEEVNDSHNSFQNRGMACDYHRRVKRQCNPWTCPQNKLFQEPISALGPGNLMPRNLIPRSLVNVPRLPDAASSYSSDSNYTFSSQSQSVTKKAAEKYSQNNGQPPEDRGLGDGNQSGDNNDNNDPRQYGDYWKPFDDSNDPKAPFNGGNIQPGGGYPRPGGGYYSLPLATLSQTTYSSTSTPHVDRNVSNYVPSLSCTVVSPRIYEYTCSNDAVPRYSKTYGTNGDNDGTIDILDSLGRLGL